MFSGLPALPMAVFVIANGGWLVICLAIDEYDPALYAMPYPPRRIVPCARRQANPRRGATLFASVRIRPSGYSPEYTPAWPDRTGATALKPGAASRLTMRPLVSTNGFTSS